METLSSASTCRHTRIHLSTCHPTEFIDVTDQLQSFVADCGLRVGVINVQTLHTTTGIVVNEHEPLLLGDFQALLEETAPCDGRYRHDDAGLRQRVEPERTGEAECELAEPKRQRRPEITAEHEFMTDGQE